MFDVRKEISARLNYEFKRRGLSPDAISYRSNVSKDVVTEYLSGIRQLNIEEIKKICECLDINPTRLLFNINYPKAKITFRKTENKVQRFATKIEDIYFLVRDSLPSVSVPVIERKMLSRNKQEIISEAVALANKVRLKYSTPQEFYQEYNIPIIPCNQPEFDFDAFLIRDRDKAVVCINNSKPPHRIQFSLAHEISHIIFDFDIDVPVDTFIPNYYWKKWLKDEDIPEFFAYKFAEFYLIPFDQVYLLVEDWPNFDKDRAQGLIESGITTVEVLANAVFDVLSFLGSSASRQDSSEIYRATGDQFQRMDYEEGLDKYSEEHSGLYVNYKSIRENLSNLHASKQSNYIYRFIEDCRKNLKLILKDQQSSLSEDIFEYILEIIKID